MRRAYRYPILMIVMSLGLSSTAFASTAKTQLMILGVAHLEARRDVHNAVFTDSPLSPTRQAEVKAVIERLARFHPTKVLIEATYGDPIWNKRYREYLAGKFTLGADERYQFGFKLAARAGDPSIYPIDTWGPSIVNDNSLAGKRIDSYLIAHFKSVKDPTFDAFLARADALERHGTYLDLLRFMNTDAAVRANASWYPVFAGMGRGADYAGASYTAQWYTRNVYIFSNILSVIRPGDRVVLIMGQGHKYLLSQLAKLDPHIEYVDVLNYLR
ncbi:MAG: DUF5694 domain-containing protein [Vulcanimicrobiaceae bacterium]